MLKNATDVARMTNILTQEGWVILENGSNVIAVENQETQEEVNFRYNDEFEHWLSQEALKWDIS